jgi:hypothetical protein
MDRRLLLLKACRELLTKCARSNHVLNVMDTIVYYDDAECDGHCLLEDIQTELIRYGVGD